MRRKKLARAQCTGFKRMENVTFFFQCRLLNVDLSRVTHYEYSAQKILNMKPKCSVNVSNIIRIFLSTKSTETERTVTFWEFSFERKSKTNHHLWFVNDIYCQTGAAEFRKVQEKQTISCIRMPRKHLMYSRDNYQTIPIQSSHYNLYLEIM